jgi:outer membrane lipoprotein-sorting protein
VRRRHAPDKGLLRSFAVAGVAVALVTAVPPRPLSAAGGRAVDILRQAVLHRGEVNYSGVATVTGGGFGRGPQTFTEVRLCKQGGKQRVQVRDGQDNLVVLRVSSGTTQWEYFPKRNSATQRPLPSSADRRKRDLENLALIARNFLPTVVGTEVIAGRKAYRIRIDRPGNPPTIVRQYWIDTHTYLELKSEHYVRPGPPTGSVTLTRVNYAPEYTAGVFSFQPPSGVKVRTPGGPGFWGTLSAAEKEAGFSAILPKKVPSGFTLLDDSVAVMQRHGQPAIWLRYSNGIDSFSLFQRRVGGPVEPRSPGPVRQWVYGGYQFTLVGWISPEQADTIQAGYR